MESKEFETHPLNLKEITPENTSNPLVQALLSLREEGYSESRAYLEEGQGIIKRKIGKVPIKDAIKVFTKGITIITDKEKEAGTLIELLLSRAQANISLLNNRSALEDLDRALKVSNNSRSDL